MSKINEKKDQVLAVERKSAWDTPLKIKETDEKHKQGKTKNSHPNVMLNEHLQQKPSDAMKPLYKPQRHRTDEDNRQRLLIQARAFLAKRKHYTLKELYAARSLPQPDIEHVLPDHLCCTFKHVLDPKKKEKSINTQNEEPNTSTSQERYELACLQQRMGIKQEEQCVPHEDIETCPTESNVVTESSSCYVPPPPANAFPPVRRFPTSKITRNIIPAPKVPNNIGNAHRENVSNPIDYSTVSTLLSALQAIASLSTERHGANVAAQNPAPILPSSRPVPSSSIALPLMPTSIGSKVSTFTYQNPIPDRGPYCHKTSKDHSYTRQINPRDARTQSRTLHHPDSDAGVAPHIFKEAESAIEQLYNAWPHFPYYYPIPIPYATPVLNSDKSTIRTHTRTSKEAPHPEVTGTSGETAQKKVMEMVDDSDLACRWDDVVRMYNSDEHKAWVSAKESVMKDADLPSFYFQSVVDLDELRTSIEQVSPLPQSRSDINSMSNEMFRSGLETWRVSLRKLRKYMNESLFANDLNSHVANIAHKDIDNGDGDDEYDRCSNSSSSSVLVLRPDMCAEQSSDIGIQEDLLRENGE